MENKRYEIIGAAMAVHNELGNGFLEAVYQEALEYELNSRDIYYESQKELSVRYKDIVLDKKYYADLVCYRDVLVELKAVKELLPEHEAQILNYLKATGYKYGLLINFGTPKLQYKPFILG